MNASFVQENWRSGCGGRGDFPTGVGLKAVSRAALFFLQPLLPVESSSLFYPSRRCHDKSDHDNVSTERDGLVLHLTR